MISPIISTDIEVSIELQGGTIRIQLKKSTDFPTTTASMNIAIPIGSFNRISMTRIVIETAIDAVPYRIPVVFEIPRLRTSHGAAPIFACIVRYTPNPFTNRLTAAISAFSRMAPTVRFSRRSFFVIVSPINYQTGCIQ